MQVKLMTGKGEITYGDVTKFEMEYPNENPSISHCGMPVEDVYYPETIMVDKYAGESEAGTLTKKRGTFEEEAKRFQFKSGAMFITVLTDYEVYLMNEQGKTVESY